jgi:putative ABC transport system permease protein
VSWRWGRRRAADDAELDAELRYHIERQVQDYVGEGLSLDEARRRVNHEFGGLDQTKEECRDVRPFHRLDEFARDVRLGFRALTRERLFAVATILILAVGIGASVTMFSVLNAVVLRPLPYARPHELVRINTHLIVQDRYDGSAPGNFFDWHEQSRAFANMTFYRRTSVSQTVIDGIDMPQRVQEGLVSADFFAVLGTAPLLGRTFTAKEFSEGQAVVVLSEGLWHEQFGGRESAVGRTLRIDGKDHVVLGVMPRAFQLPTTDTRIWRPYSMLPGWASSMTVRDADIIEVIGRLVPGVRFEDARSEMRLIAQRLRQSYAENANIDVRLVPLLDHVIGVRTRQGIWMAFAAVLSLLAIACANVGGLLMVRSATRRREFAVRAALGASRARLMHQLIAECISLWAIATTLGLAIAYTATRLLVTYGPRALPRIDEVSLDVTAITLALVGGLAVVLLCGSVPALLAARTSTDGVFATRDSGGLPQPRMQSALVTSQIAGAIVLLVTALLFAQSFVRAQSEDPGYAADGLLVARIELPAAAYPDRAARATFFNLARQRLLALPGVTGVGGVTDFFLRRNADQWITLEGRAPGRIAGAPRLSIEGVTPGFFESAGIQLIEGRGFTEADFVVDAVARRFWPGARAVGKGIVSGELPPKDGRWGTVVGVVGDIRRESRDVTPFMNVYIPAYPRPFDLVVRVASAGDSLMAAIRAELRAIDRAIPAPTIFSAGTRLAERLDGRRFETQVLGVFGAIALLLSAAGLYALLAYQVALRTREIGIRTALGADRRSIVGMVLGRGLRLALVGAAAGILVAAAIARALQSLLYETAAFDGVSYAAGVVVMLAIAVVASGIPAMRAGEVTPMTALRDQ